MNIPTQTQIVSKIIRESLPWNPIDSSLKIVRKPKGSDDLVTLLICHKDGIGVEISQSTGHALRDFQEEIVADTAAALAETQTAKVL